jgi:lipoprotein signal peptidase
VTPIRFAQTAGRAWLSINTRRVNTSKKEHPVGVNGLPFSVGGSQTSSIDIFLYSFMVQNFISYHKYTDNGRMTMVFPIFNLKTEE